MTMSNDTVQLVDEVFRNRWRTLVSVDKMVYKVGARSMAEDNLSFVIHREGKIETSFFKAAEESIDALKKFTPF